MEYHAKNTLRISDRTSTGQLRFSTLMSLMQEAADEHSAIYGLNNTALLEKGYAWVLTRMAVKIFRAGDGKEVDVKTCALPGRAIEFPREYTVSDRNGKIAYGLSYWSVISMENRRLARVGDINGYKEMTVNKSADIIYDKLRLSLTDEYDCVSVHTVLNTEIDVLGHMNNIYYADIVENSLSNEEFSDYVDINISFIREAKLGDAIDIYKVKRDNAIEVIGLLNGEICFSARIS